MESSSTNCNTCNRTFQNAQDLHTHLQSPEHKEEAVRQNLWVCPICPASTTGLIPFQDHLGSVKHSKKVATATANVKATSIATAIFAKSAATATVNAPSTSSASATATSSVSVTATANQPLEEDGKLVSEGQLYCNICNCDISGTKGYIEHMNGVKHLRELQKKLRLNPSGFQCSFCHGVHLPPLIQTIQNHLHNEKGHFAGMKQFLFEKGLNLARLTVEERSGPGMARSVSVPVGLVEEQQPVDFARSSKPLLSRGATIPSSLANVQNTSPSHGAAASSMLARSMSLSPFSPGNSTSILRNSASPTHRAVADTDTDKRLCEVCQVLVPSGNIEEHERGSKHMKKLQAASQGAVGRDCHGQLGGASSRATLYHSMGLAPSQDTTHSILATGDLPNGGGASAEDIWLINLDPTSEVKAEPTASNVAQPHLTSGTSKKVFCS